MISIPGSLSLFCQVGDDVIRPRAPAKSSGDASHATQDSFIHLMSNTISTPICIRSAFLPQGNEYTTVHDLTKGPYTHNFMWRHAVV